MDQYATIASLVMDLTERRMWLASGNPCTAPYLELEVPWATECRLASRDRAAIGATTAAPRVTYAATCSAATRRTQSCVSSTWLKVKRWAPAMPSPGSSRCAATAPASGVGS